MALGSVCGASQHYDKQYVEPHTPHWPDSAFRPVPQRRARGRSAVEADGKASKPLVKVSRERHLSEAERFANPVLSTYLLDDTYSDYRGACFKARVHAAQRRGHRVRAHA